MLGRGASALGRREGGGSGDGRPCRGGGTTLAYTRRWWRAALECGGKEALLQVRAFTPEDAGASGVSDVVVLEWGGNRVFENLGFFELIIYLNLPQIHHTHMAGARRLPTRCLTLLHLVHRGAARLTRPSTLRQCLIPCTLLLHVLHTPTITGSASNHLGVLAEAERLALVLVIREPDMAFSAYAPGRTAGLGAGGHGLGEGGPVAGGLALAGILRAVGGEDLGF